MEISKLLQSGLLLVSVLSVSACSSNSGEQAAQSQTELFGNAAQVLADDSDALVSPEDSLALETENSSSLEYMRIKHHKVECEGMQVSHCMLVQKEGSEEWAYLYEQIGGLDYQWGYEYEVLVQAIDVDNGLSDTASRRYELLEILSTTAPVSQTSFSYTSRNTQERIVAVDSLTFSLLGDKDFTCTADSCDSLRSAIAQNQSVVLSFEHDARLTTPLVLTAVLCSDAAESFNGACL